MRLPEFLHSQQMKIAILSALCADRLQSHGDRHGTSSCQRLGLPQGHSAARKIDSTRHRTRDLPAFRTVPQRTAPPRKPS